MDITSVLLLPLSAMRRVLLTGRRAAVAVRAAARRLRGRFIGLALSIAWLIAHVVGLVRVAVAERGLALPDSYLRRWEGFTRVDLTPDTATLLLIAGVSLWSLRVVVLEARAYLGGASVEVRPLVNATGQEHNLAGLDAMFSSFLALPRRYQITSLPGDTEQERLIEVLTATGPDKPRPWQELARRAYAYALPRRAFVVEPVLRHRPARERYEVTVHIRRLPGPFVELDTVWSGSVRRALQRAAFQIGAHVLPQTRACRAEPWTGWQGKTLPPELFRGYQRAKRMVLERRYDEALHLYREALQLDPDNVVLRYELGQLYERLRLTSDALVTYLDLMNEIFPWRPGDQTETTDGARAPKRRDFPRWWPARTSGPFLIRYRYVVALSSGALAEELHRPNWLLLRQMLGAEAGVPPAMRPFRRVEVADLRHRLAAVLDRFGPFVAGQWPADSVPVPPVCTLTALLARPVDDPVVARQIELYTLVCARAEAAALRRSFARVIGPWRSHASATTLTTCRQIELLVRYRIELARQRPLTSPLPAAPDATAPGAPQSGSGPMAALTAPGGPLSADTIAKDLRANGYRESSPRWLEHYVAACAYALPLVDDAAPRPEHAEHAHQAAAALARAERFGEDVSFPTSKQFWVVAGDPDLAGLRQYPDFRAFEARAYSHPLPAARSLAEFERYLYSMHLLGAAAKVVEQRWLAAAAALPERYALEELWREEYEAWQLMIRMGLFHRQWQTRRLLHHTVRTWFERTGREMDPVPYPNVLGQRNSPYMDDAARIEDELTAVQRLLDHLGSLGDLDARHLPDDVSRARTILPITRTWIAAAQAASRLVEMTEEQRRELDQAMRRRIELWTALRHWTEDPLAGGAGFRRALARQAPPRTWATLRRRLPLTPAVRRSPPPGW